ncbi:MAG: PD40 domain-containing protein [Acidobacteria bacterium]|nr:PD40 domain-containing protein [Acidobacteriota bacterium]
MQPSDEIATEQSRSSEWQELRGHVQHQTVEVLRLIAILVQDAVILVAGFIAEYAYEHWLHSEHPFFQLAVSLSSAFFLLLYVITVTVHVVQYVRGQVGATKATWLGDKLPWAIIGGGVLAAAIALTMPSFRSVAVAPAKSIRFPISAPEKTQFAGAPVTPMAVSPNGTQVVFAAFGEGGLPQLWVRSLDSLEARPLPGTEGLGITAANSPSWSPDSRFIVFSQQAKLKKIEVVGGPPQVLTDTGPLGYSGSTWNRDGTIVFGSTTDGLFRVSAAGSEAVQITKPEPSRGEFQHVFPHFLPDGHHFLYLVTSGQPEVQGIYLGSLDSKETKRLVGVASRVEYAPPGYLLYVRDGTLLAHPFDAERLQLSGDPFPIAEQVGFNPFNGAASFSVAESGVLAYRGGFLGETQLVWLDRGGKQVGMVGPPGQYLNPRLSPDGKQVAIENVISGNRDIWTLEVERGIATRFTFDPAWDFEPLWSPDSNRVLFASNRGGTFGFYQKLISGAGDEELVYKSGAVGVAPFDWSANGRLRSGGAGGLMGVATLWRTQAIHILPIEFY